MPKFEIFAPDGTERLWTIDEICERLNISARTVLRWRRKGLAYRKVLRDGRRRILFSGRSIARFMDVQPPLSDSHSEPFTGDSQARRGAAAERRRNQARIENLLRLPLDYVASPEFDEPVAAQKEAEMLGCGPLDENRSAAAGVAKITELSEVPEFLLQLGCRKLLTAERERHLFRKMNYLRFLASRLREGLRDGRTGDALLTRIEKYYEESLCIKNEIVAANLRLVISIAKKQIGSPLSFCDLISDGNLSLLKAVEKFDYTRGNKFSTYASWAIWRNYARTIPDERKHLDRFRPVDTEIFEARVDSRSTYWQETRLRTEQLSQVGRFLDELDERERSIIQRRYGLGRHESPQTLRQVGSEIGVTKERVRQIETRAIEKLRKVAEAEHFEIPEPY